MIASAGRRGGRRDWRGRGAAPAAPLSCAALASGGAPATLDTFTWGHQIAPGQGSDVWDFVWIENGCTMRYQHTNAMRTATLSSAEWSLKREGDLVSLWPSVGNWDYPCRSHYWIRRNRVIEALPMTERQIARVHQRDAADLARMLAAKNAEKDRAVAPGSASPSVDGAQSSQLHSDEEPRAKNEGRLRTLWRRLFGR